MLPSGVLGVDLGTSHTVAVLRGVDGSAAPLLFDGSPLLPSAVYAESDETLLVGRDAIHSARLRPERFEPNPKRRVDDGTVLLGDNEIEVVRMFAAILTRVRSEAERVVGALPSKTVITHPAVWGPARRLVLTDACEQAQLGEVTLVPEPVAAARYFAALPSMDIALGTVVVVYDFGGGTFDVSVVEATANGHAVLAVDGSDSLGGVDIDHALAGHIGQRFDGDARWATLINPTDATGRRHRRTFLDDVRGAKERLSRQTRVELLVPVLDVDTHLTREELETVTGPLLNRAVRLTEAVIRAAAVRKEQVAGVFLVGGSSRMPLAATTLHQRTEIAPTVIDQPELVVATGATMSAPATAQVFDPPVGPPPSPVGPAAGPPSNSSSPYAAPPHMSPPVSSPPTGLVAPLQAPGPSTGRTVLKILHWAQFTLLVTMMLSVVVMATMYPNADLIIWLLMPLFGGILPAASAIFTAINAVRITNDPQRAHRGIKITQSLTVGYLTVLAILVEATLTPEPVIRFLSAGILIIAAVILGLAQLSRPPDLAAHWQGPKQLRTTVGLQFGFILVAAAVMLAWWVTLWTFDRNRGPSVIVGDTVAATSTIAAFSLLVLLVAGLVKADRLSASLRSTLIAAQSVWLLVAGLYMIPWLYIVDHRLLPGASGDDVRSGRIALSDQPWTGNGTAEVLNVTGLWFLVASAIPAVLVVVQLATMPRNVTNSPHMATQAFVNTGLGPVRRPAGTRKPTRHRKRPTGVDPAGRRTVVATGASTPPGTGPGPATPD